MTGPPSSVRPVLLYNKAARPENPMRSVEFKNSTGLTLEGGPVTVLEGGSYVGEAMLETLKPSEERLVPYAVELGVRVLLPWWLIGSAAGVTLTMALLSGLAALRSLRLVEPITLLR